MYSGLSKRGNANRGKDLADFIGWCRGYERHLLPNGDISNINRVKSKFMTFNPVDLTGAGDSFRAGLIACIARNQERFRDGSMDFGEALQMGNLFASLYVTPPMDRYSLIRDYKSMGSRIVYGSLTQLQDALNEKMDMTHT